ncbi:hypothetical protein H5J25_04205 [Sphingomonas aliaeris]|uniref:Uncharacterized protein n=1 Tax=Sphingomonas aliaeris TaxID=2759526 RepID=A0A974NW40_9SPHN|nr:hypothetical protein [Sphingomonas aliaeris]QQV77958.1 hypothetical protein H5J25_04205 [Sphingomonas aliaeris]
MMEVARERHRPFGRKADRFRDLLRRYPELTTYQLDEMVSIYDQLSTLEVALLSADERVAEQFDAFLHSHSGRLQMLWRDHLVFALAFIGSFASIVGLIVAVMR